MLLLRLPELIAATDIADMAGSLAGLYDRTVLIDATGTASALPSLAAVLVEHILVGHEARQLVILGGPAPFTDAAIAAGERFEVGGRLVCCDTEPITEDYPQTASRV